MFCLQTCKGLIKWISKYLRKKHWQLVGRLTLTLTLDIEIVRNAQVFLMKRHSVKGDCWKAKQWWDKYFWTAKNILLCLTLIKFYLKLLLLCCSFAVCWDQTLFFHMLPSHNILSIQAGDLDLKLLNKTYTQAAL